MSAGVKTIGSDGSANKVFLIYISGIWHQRWWLLGEYLPLCCCQNLRFDTTCMLLGSCVSVFTGVFLLLSTETWSIFLPISSSNDSYAGVMWPSLPVIFGAHRLLADRDLYFCVLLKHNSTWSHFLPFVLITRSSCSAWDGVSLQILMFLQPEICTTHIHGVKSVMCFCFSLVILL